MKRIHIPIVALTLSALMLSGCAALQKREQAGADRVCVRIAQINSFNPLDDRHVLASISASKHYLLTIDQGCFGLKYARSMGIAEPMSRVCGDGTSFLTFNHPGAGTMRCRIMKIEPVEDEDAAMALIGK